MEASERCVFQDDPCRDEKCAGVRDQRRTDTGTWRIDDDTYHIYAAEQQMNPLALKSKEHDAAEAAGQNQFTYKGVSMCLMHPV